MTCPKRLSRVIGPIIVLAAGCPRSGPEIRELKRLTSPDQALDLVLAEIPTGATDSTPYQVFVVARGKPAGEDYLVFNADWSASPEIAWSGVREAVISCQDARVWRFTNFASIRLSGGEFASASIRLDCGQRGYLRR